MLIFDFPPPKKRKINLIYYMGYPSKNDEMYIFLHALQFQTIFNKTVALIKHVYLV